MLCLLYYDFLQPEPEPERKNSLSEKKSSSPNHNGDAAEESGHVPSEYLHYVDLIQKIDNIVNVAVDTNLIQLDTDDMASNTNNTYADNDDDLIFEVREKLCSEFVYSNTYAKKV